MSETGLYFVSNIVCNLFDDVIVKLQKSSLGCKVSGLCVNAIMYADDIILLAISITDLQKMVELCLNAFHELDMRINVKKSMCMRIGSKFNSAVRNIIAEGIEIEWKSELKYLGVSLVAGKSLKCNLQVIKQKYFRALNGIFAKIGTRSDPMLTLSLFKSFCLPLLSYSLEAFKLNKSSYNTLESAHVAAFF